MSKNSAGNTEKRRFSKVILPGVKVPACCTNQAFAEKWQNKGSKGKC